MISQQWLIHAHIAPGIKLIHMSVMPGEAEAQFVDVASGKAKRDK